MKHLCAILTIICLSQTSFGQKSQVFSDTINPYWETFKSALGDTTGMADTRRYGSILVGGDPYAIRFRDTLPNRRTKFDNPPYYEMEFLPMIFMWRNIPKNKGRTLYLLLNNLDHYSNMRKSDSVTIIVYAFKLTGITEIDWSYDQLMRPIAADLYVRDRKAHTWTQIPVPVSSLPGEKSSNQNEPLFVDHLLDELFFYKNNKRLYDGSTEELRPFIDQLKKNSNVYATITVHPANREQKRKAKTLQKWLAKKSGVYWKEIVINVSKNGDLGDAAASKTWSNDCLLIRIDEKPSPIQ